MSGMRQSLTNHTQEFKINPFGKIAPSLVLVAPGVFNLDINKETQYQPGELLATRNAAVSEWIWKIFPDFSYLTYN